MMGSGKRNTKTGFDIKSGASQFPISGEMTTKCLMQARRYLIDCLRTKGFMVCPVEFVNQSSANSDCTLAFFSEKIAQYSVAAAAGNYAGHSREVE